MSLLIFYNSQTVSAGANTNLAFASSVAPSGYKVSIVSKILDNVLTSVSVQVKNISKTLSSNISKNVFVVRLFLKSATVTQSLVDNYSRIVSFTKNSSLVGLPQYIRFLNRIMTSNSITIGIYSGLKVILFNLLASVHVTSIYSRLITLIKSSTVASAALYLKYIYKIFNTILSITLYTVKSFFLIKSSAALTNTIRMRNVILFKNAVASNFSFYSRIVSISKSYAITLNGFFTRVMNKSIGLSQSTLSSVQKLFSITKILTASINNIGTVSRSITKYFSAPLLGITNFSRLIYVSRTLALSTSNYCSKQISKIFTSIQQYSIQIRKSVGLIILAQFVNVSKLNKFINKSFSQSITTISDFNNIRSLFRNITTNISTISGVYKNYFVLLNSYVSNTALYSYNILRLFYESVRKMILQRENRNMIISPPDEITIEKKNRDITL